MNSVTLLQPPRIVFGKDCAQQCGEFLLQRQVKRVLLVTSTPILKTITLLLDSLAKMGLTVVNSPPVDVEPTVAMFQTALEAAQREKFDAVLGIGGGSPMDMAKLIAALHGGAQRIEEVLGINLLKNRNLPLVCLPTTSGTGSEVSPNAILLDETECLKKGVISPHLVPDAAFVDPLLTLSVPPTVTASTGLDALTHCIEAFANKFAHPVVDLYAREGIRQISASLPRAVRDGSDVEARTKLALGSLLGGLCLGPVNTAAVHALAYPLGSEFHVAHGVSNALLLPHVIQFNLAAAPSRYAEVAVGLGVQRNQSDLATARHGVERLFDLVKECGVPRRLSEVGVPRDAIPRMAKAAMKVIRLLKNNLRPVTESDAIQIYEAAY